MINNNYAAKIVHDYVERMAIAENMVERLFEANGILRKASENIWENFYIR